MKTITRRAATLVAAGLLGLGGLAVAAPALAGHGPFGGAGTTTAGGHGYGPGHGMGFGSCIGPGLPAEKGTLTTTQKATLASTAQNEKLAQDLYAAFAARYSSPVFPHIAMAESHHLSAVRTLLQRYGLSDPTANQAAGKFTDQAVQIRYDKLLGQGEMNPAAASAVGRQVERDTIAALTAATDGLSAADVNLTYARLLTASERHLAAFSR